MAAWWAIPAVIIADNGRCRSTTVTIALLPLPAQGTIGFPSSSPRAPRDCPTAVDRQVDSLSSLPDRWFDDDSRAFDPAALEWLGKLLGAVQEAFRLPTPYVYPTPEGQARAEWPGAGWEVVVNVDLRTREADLTAVKLGSDRVDEDHVVLGQPGGKNRLGKFVVEHWQ